MKIGLLINENYDYVMDLFDKHKESGFVITMLIDRNIDSKDKEILENNIVKFSLKYFLEINY